MPENTGASGIFPLKQPPQVARWKGIPGSPSINKRVFAPPKRNTDTKYYTGSVEEMAKAIVDTLEAERLI